MSKARRFVWGRSHAADETCIVNLKERSVVYGMDEHNCKRAKSPDSWGASDASNAVLEAQQHPCSLAAEDISTCLYRSSQFSRSSLSVPKDWKNCYSV